MEAKSVSETLKYFYASVNVSLAKFTMSELKSSIEVRTFFKDVLTACIAQYFVLTNKMQTKSGLKIVTTRNV